LPVETASSAFGPRLQAAVTTLSIRNRVSRRDVVELVEQLFGARISTGNVEAILTRAGDALEEPYADLLDRVRAHRHLNMDETGWRTAEQRRALWGVFTDRHAILTVAENRHEDHARLSVPGARVPLLRRLGQWRLCPRDMRCVSPTAGRDCPSWVARWSWRRCTRG
jgi:hypothetical protein